MPELPEVETIKKQLAQCLIGKKWKGKQIVGVRRRAKLLFIDLEDRSSLVFHLKLTGQLIFNGRVSKYTRQIFNFDDGSRLIFNDARKFGWWKKVKNSQKLEEEFGPDALTITLEDLTAGLVKKGKSRIKPLLMDQKFIAGIGNIYSDEILFEAGVAPLRLVKTLSPQEIKKIFQNISQVLQAAIKYHGSSVEYYVDAYGRKGSYERYHQVYHRERCPRCETKIKKIKMGGRGAHYCPKCQK